MSIFDNLQNATNQVDGNVFKHMIDKELDKETTESKDKLDVIQFQVGMKVNIAYDAVISAVGKNAHEVEVTLPNGLHERFWAPVDSVYPEHLDNY